MTDMLVLAADEVPPSLRAWLNTQEAPRLLVKITTLEDGSLALLQLPGVDPGLVERALVSIAKYREALMNLT